ncbi:MAG: AEC family transporter [Rhodospirillales bacterium]|nr:AEC family transporter [Rhodospirillales bacterium]
MIPIFSALTPVFLMILLGYMLKKRELVSEAFWSPAEKMTYFLFFPSLLLANTAKAEFGEIDVTPMIWASCSGVLVISALALLARPRLDLDGPAFTSVFQGTIRPNVYLGIAAAVALYDGAGLTLVSVCVAVVVPLVNILSVIVLVRHARQRGDIPNWSQTLEPVARNPLIIACALGALLNVTGIGLPPLIGPFLEILGRAALPIGLLAVGAGLDFDAMRKAGLTVGLTTAVKLCALPAITYLTCQAFGVSGLSQTIVVLYAALPVSATSYVLARQMGGDTALLAGTITATTVFAMITMPIIVVLLS